MLHKFFLLTIILITGLNATQAQTTTMWNATHVATTINHIKNVAPKEGDSWKFAIDAHEELILSESAAGEQIITISTREWGGTIFFSEQKSFKGNIATLEMKKDVLYHGDSIFLPRDFRYFFRLTESEKTRIIGKVESYLSNFSTKKPALWVAPPPAPGLFEGTDPLAKEFARFINFIMTKGQKVKEEYTWENEDITITWHNSLHFLYVWEGEIGKMITFDEKKHCSQGEVVGDENVKINENQLTQIMNLIKS